MLFRRPVDGLEPNTKYRVGYSVRFATEDPSGCPGIGGSPGDAVKVIASSGTIKPEPFTGTDGDDYYLLNVQHRDDPQEWYQNAIMEDIGNTRGCEEEDVFEFKEVSSGPGHDQVTTDKDGSAWILFGTRSGFEGQTELFYTRFRAEFRK